MNTKRRRTLIRLTKKLEGIKKELNQVCQEEQLALDNLPANVRQHGKADAMESVVDSLEQADSSLNEVITYLNDAINEEVEYREIGEHIGQDRARNIIWRLISADVLDGILFGSPQKVTVIVHDLDMLKEKLDIYDRCRNLKERFCDRHPNIDVFGPYHSTAIQKTIGTYSLAIRLTEERMWWICEVTKEARGMGSIGDYATPLELAPEILDEFKGIFDTFEDTVMRKEFFASIEDPIDGFVKAYEKLTQLEKEGKLPQF